MLRVKSCFVHIANTGLVEHLILSLGITDEYQDGCSQFHSRGPGQHFTELSYHLRRCCLPVRCQNTAEQEGGN